LQVTREQANTGAELDLDLTVEPATLTGLAYLDANANGAFDEGEDVLEDAIVSVGNTTATTDAAGQYTLEGLLPGRTVVDAALDGYRTRGANQVDLVGGEVQEHNISMEFTPVTVRGVVEDQAGEETEGIEAVFAPVNGSETARENSAFSQINGTLTLDLQPGTYMVGGNGTINNQTLEIVSVEVTGGTGASVDEDGNLVIDPRATSVEVLLKVAPVE
ncbi:MAG: carboxypeptidase-like regulatory domain-containing protein, partial [Candidatus Thermoplasmatota archaeon]|nr:carboxypeptidase-like regulatory domain-containing protein [Candidatus Thermoplasmatota archaeon]